MQEEVKIAVEESTREWEYSKPADSELESTRRLAQMVRDHISRYGLTHAEFCKASGDILTRNQLQPLINGERKTVSLWMMTALARAMNLPPHVVLGRCGLAFSTHDVPYTPEGEQMAYLYDLATIQLPLEGKRELIERGGQLINEIIEKYKTRP